MPLELRDDVFKSKKANESFSFAAPLEREKFSHSPVCDSVFLGLSGQNFADLSSRPTKILKISAFRDFFVTVPKCQKGAKNRVKTRFLRRISILCSSYGGSDGNRTHVRKPLDTTFFVGSLFFILPVRRREQTRFSSR